MNEQDRQALERRARQLRRDVLQMTYEAQSGHPGGSCSLADLMAYLYFYRLRYDTASPKSPSRDRLVLSKGHAAPVLYAALGESGFFPKEEFHRLRKIGSLLQGHPASRFPAWTPPPARSAWGFRWGPAWRSPRSAGSPASGSM